jgi:endonuclease YncB( thermonuclease family)
VPWALALLVALLLSPRAGGADTPVVLEGTVLRIVDGDTIRVRLGDRVERVRYIGVNTPELHHPVRGEEPGGREAREVNRGLVESRRVRLEIDVQSRDRYGRLLAYVWVGDVMINAELVRLGFAQVMTVPPNVRHQALFVELQRDARAARRGLWGADARHGAAAEPAQRRSYSSWRRNQSFASLRPLGARSSHWYMPQRPSSPRA